MQVGKTFCRIIKNQTKNAAKISWENVPREGTLVLFLKMNVQGRSKWTMNACRINEWVKRLAHCLTVTVFIWSVPFVLLSLFSPGKGGVSIEMLVEGDEKGNAWGPCISHKNNTLPRTARTKCEEVYFWNNLLRSLNPALSLGEEREAGRWFLWLSRHSTLDC